jgi:hypothetical protein
MVTSPAQTELHRQKPIATASAATLCIHADHSVTHILLRCNLHNLHSAVMYVAMIANSVPRSQIMGTVRLCEA